MNSIIHTLNLYLIVQPCPYTHTLVEVNHAVCTYCISFGRIEVPGDVQKQLWKKEKEEEEAAYRTHLEKKIAKKKEKIKMLKEEICQKDSDLQSIQQEARSLIQAQSRLTKICEAIKQVQKENERLTCSHSIEKEKVIKLVQITANLTADITKIEV